MERASIPYRGEIQRHVVGVVGHLNQAPAWSRKFINLTCSYITISHPCPRKQDTWLTTIVMHITSRPCNKRTQKHTPNTHFKDFFFQSLWCFNIIATKRGQKQFVVKIASRFFQRSVRPKSLTAILPLRKPLPTVVPELKDVGPAVFGVTLSLGIRTWSKVRWPGGCPGVRQGEGGPKPRRDHL